MWLGVQNFAEAEQSLIEKFGFSILQITLYKVIKIPIQDSIYRFN